MPRTRALLGATAGLLLVAGAVVAATSDAGPTLGRSAVDSAAEQPQSPAAASPPVGNFNSFGLARGDANAKAGAAAPDAVGTSALGTTASSAGSAPVGATPRVVKTATLTVSAAEGAVARLADQVPGIASGAGGYVTSSERTGSGSSLRAHYTVRVPADRFDVARTAMTKLGKVTDETLSGRDVTGQLVDYEARLRSMRAEEEAFRSILSKANTVGDTLQVTQALSEVRGRIEQLDAERAHLADAADLSTIDLTIAGPAGAIVEPSTESLLSRSVTKAAGAALAIVGGTVIVLGAAVPLLVLAGLAALVYRAAARRRRRAIPAVAS